MHCCQMHKACLAKLHVHIAKIGRTPTACCDGSNAKARYDDELADCLEELRKAVSRGLGNVEYEGTPHPFRLINFTGAERRLAIQEPGSQHAVWAVSIIKHSMLTTASTYAVWSVILYQCKCAGLDMRRCRQCRTLELLLQQASTAG